MTTHTLTINQVRAELDNGYELSKIRRDNILRHSRGWVSSTVDFVLLGLPLVAPIPNLINLAIALSPVMGVTASIIAAVAFELLLFGSAEIILYLQDKQMRDGGYDLALKIAIGCGAAFVAILLTLIAAYEVPVHGLAVLTLPFVSVISIAFLSLKRWADIRDSIAKDRAHYDDRLTVALSKVSTLSANLETANLEIEQLKASNIPVVETVLDRGRDKANANKQATATQRRIKFLNILDKTTSKNELNFAEIGRNLEGVSGQTIANDLKWLEGQGHWENGSSWKLTDRGQALIESSTV